jgi:hypothetical protein
MKPADATNGHPIELQPRARLLRRVFALTAVAGLALPLAFSLASSAAAKDNGSGRGCGTHTLRGAYGLIGTGSRGLGPGAAEAFATVSMVTYDGAGAFTAEGTSHGQTTGVRGGPVTGTYFVNDDCTGGQTTIVPGVPPLEDRFVIVDNGREVRTVVIAPLTTIATANLRRR